MNNDTASFSHIVGVLFGVLLVLAAQSVQAQSGRISVDGQDIWMSGGNVAWVNFAHDVGPGSTNLNQFDQIFQQVENNGGNAMRLWVHTNGVNSPAWNSNGEVTGPGVGTIQDLNDILDKAQDHGIGLQLCLWSFDMLKDYNGQSVVDRNYNFLKSSSKIQTYIDNALVPMVNQLKDHPALIAWEIFNEPEGMTVNYGWTNTTISMWGVRRFINMTAAAIHNADPDAKVTTGAWSFKSLYDQSAGKRNVPHKAATDAEVAEAQQALSRKYRGNFSKGDARNFINTLRKTSSDHNYYTDTQLRNAGGKQNGTLDFYNVHYYEWAGTSLSPFDHNKSHWGLSKPLVVAEFYMGGTHGEGYGDGNDNYTWGLYYGDFFKELYNRGYAGGMGWQWAGDEGDTNWPRILENTQTLQNLHPGAVSFNPGGSGGGGAARFEAENANYSGNITKLNGGSGGNYLYMKDSGSITFTVNADYGGSHNVTIRYALPYSKKKQDILVNGSYSQQRTFDGPTYTWLDENFSVNLQQGSNTITIQKSWGYTQFDYIDVSGASHVGGPSRYEAENANYGGSISQGSDGGASGNAYLDMTDNGTITFNNVQALQSGSYNITLRYKMAYGDPKTQDISVNYGQSAFSVEFYGGSEQWKTKEMSVYLDAGSNTLKVKKSWGWMYFDYLEVSGSPSAKVSSISQGVTSFQGRSEGGAAVLTWQVAPGFSGASSLVVQRRADEGNWMTLGRRVQHAADAADKQAGAYHLRTASLDPGTYSFRLKRRHGGGTTEPVTVEVGMMKQAVLKPAYPNPVQSRAKVHFAVKKKGPVTVMLYNTLGQKVRTLYRGTPEGAQFQTVNVDGSGLPSGVYLMRLRGAGVSKTQSLTIAH